MIQMDNLIQAGRRLAIVVADRDLFLGKENLIVMPLSSKVFESEIRALKGCESGSVVVCDFKIEEIETGQPIRGSIAYQRNDLLNIDHHANLESMFRPVSSANLAIEYVKLNGPIDRGVPIVVNHYDCDSVLSALIMRGLIPPFEVFGDAVIAADHTGEDNPIADLLQSFKDQKDLEFSARNLALYLQGQAIEPRAQELLDIRLATRASLAQLPIERIGKMVLVKTDGRVDAELFPGLYPDAQVVMSYHLRTDEKWEVRLRLGKAAPLGLNLQKLNIKGLIDPGFGGRWNAGSNERGGGTALDPKFYCQEVDRLL